MSVLKKFSFHCKLSFSPQDYISCAEAWIEYVCKHFTVSAGHSLSSPYPFIKKFNLAGFESEELEHLRN